MCSGKNGNKEKICATRVNTRRRRSRAAVSLILSLQCMDTCKGASIFFNGFQNPNNVRIGVGGWVMAGRMFRFQNQLFIKIGFELKEAFLDMNE